MPKVPAKKMSWLSGSTPKEPKGSCRQLEEQVAVYNTPRKQPVNNPPQKTNPLPLRGRVRVGVKSPKNQQSPLKRQLRPHPRRPRLAIHQLRRRHILQRHPH